MKRWNGWGDDRVESGLAPEALDLLNQWVGPGARQKDCPRSALISRMAPSRLPRHPLVSIDRGQRLDHAHGQSLPDWVRLRGGLLPPVPDGVAAPSTVEDVRGLLAFARAQHAQVIPYGGGTSVVGHLAVPPSERAVLTLSMARLDRLIALDQTSRLATFEAGICGPAIENALRPHGYTLGHFPQSFEFSSLGGWVATRSAGQQSRHFGRIEELFAGGHLLSSGGTLSLPPFPASAAGPDLRQLVLGSEGRLGILANVIVRISPLPERNEVVGVFFPQWEIGRQAVADLAATDMPVSMIRLSTATETAASLAMSGKPRQSLLLKRFLKLRGISTEKACLCLVGFTGSEKITRLARRQALALLRSRRAVSVGSSIGKTWQRNRFRSAYLRNALWDRGYAVDTLETAVPWCRVDQTLKAIEGALQAAAGQFDERLLVLTHLSHVYRSGSSIYTTIVFRLAPTPEETLERWQRLKQAASTAIVANGGTISHQHGVGVDHCAYLAAEKGDIGMEALGRAISAFDPHRMFNPGKLLSDNALGNARPPPSTGGA